MRTPLLRNYLMSERHKCSNSDGMCVMCEYVELFEVKFSFLNFVLMKFISEYFHYFILGILLWRKRRFISPIQITVFNVDA